MLTIDIHTARRFILGKQGLWPGRRWQANIGTIQAMQAIEYLQLDPLQVIARSHDIQLHSRVLDYSPGLWQEVTYQQRQFFTDKAFAEALARGFARFVTFLRATEFEATVIEESQLRQRAVAVVQGALDSHR